MGACTELMILLMYRLSTIPFILYSYENNLKDYS